MNYYLEIKNQLINNEITKRVKDYSKNKSDLQTYYNVGKLLVDAGKHYGEGIIKKYSIKLIKEIDGRYNVTSLKRMRQFYRMVEKGATVSHQLTWSHYVELIPLERITEINYYIEMVENYNLSIRQLREKIKNKEYERLPEDTKNNLITDKDNKVIDYIKNPIIIRNPKELEVKREKALQELILDDIENFMKELGNSFSFIGSEYKIKMGNSYNFIDLLLYNIEFNCYVVVELKVTELRKEHIGQIEVYMNYIDNNLRRINQDKTIGIIICKKNNKFIMEYCSDPRILSKEYSVV